MNDGRCVPALQLNDLDAFDHTYAYEKDSYNSDDRFALASKVLVLAEETVAHEYELYHDLVEERLVHVQEVADTLSDYFGQFQAAVDAIDVDADVQRFIRKHGRETAPWVQRAAPPPPPPHPAERFRLET